MRLCNLIENDSILVNLIGGIKVNVVFVNGSYHGDWYFDKVIQLLKYKNINALAIKPPEFSSYNHTITMDNYLNNMYEQIKDMNDSSGGQIITNYAIIHPNNIKKLVYVSGTLLPEGYCNMDIPRSEREHPVVPKVRIQGNYKMYEHNTKEEKILIKNYFYNCCTKKEAEDAIDKLLPQSLDILKYKNRGKVNEDIERYYIKCMKDQVMFPTVQQKMIDLVPCKKVYSLKDSDHVPFLSQPNELVDILIKIIYE